MHNLLFQFEAVFVECATGVHTVTKLDASNQKIYYGHLFKLDNLPKEQRYFGKVFKTLRKSIATTGTYVYFMLFIPIHPIRLVT